MDAEGTSGASTGSLVGRGRGPPGPAARVRCRVPVDQGGAAAARRGVGRPGRHLVGHVLERAGPRRGRRRAVEPAAPRRGAATAYVTDKLPASRGPVVAVSDYMRAVPLQIARWVPGDYRVLGADGFGFADTRPAARRFFRSTPSRSWSRRSRRSPTPARSSPKKVEEAFAKYRIDDPTAVAGASRRAATPDEQGTTPLIRPSVDRECGSATELGGKVKRRRQALVIEVTEAFCLPVPGALEQRPESGPGSTSRAGSCG